MVVYRLSVTFSAPIKFVYDWCTDYREDDPQIYGASHRRIIQERTKKRVIYASEKTGLDGSPKLAVRVITLSPSTYSWHLDYFAEEDLEKGEYKLKKLDKGKTRLDLVFRNTWKNGKGPSKEELAGSSKSSWDAFAPAL
jgi:hypothetical protein